MKLGKIRVTKQLYKDCYHLFADYIFKVFIPYKIEIQLNGIIEFQGESELFEDINDGDLIPNYDFTFTAIENGRFSFKINKI